MKMDYLGIDFGGIDMGLVNAIVAVVILVTLIGAFNMFLRRRRRIQRKQRIARIKREVAEQVKTNRKRRRNNGTASKDAFDTLVDMSQITNFPEEKPVAIDYPTHEKSVARQCKNNYGGLTSFSETPKAIKEDVPSGLGSGWIVEGTDEENKRTVIDTQGSYYSREGGCDLHHQ